MGSDLLVVLTSEREATAITNITSIGNVDVQIRFHERLNSCKGSIYAPEFINEDTTLILEELRDQGVTEVYRPPNSRGRHILTFNRTTLPGDVKLCLNLYRTEVYIPNPLRCKRCLLLGHHFRACVLPERCSGCGDMRHEGVCSSRFCPNCETDDHCALSNTCPKFIFEKQVEKIKTLEGCSRRVAFSRCSSRAAAPLAHPRTTLLDAGADETRELLRDLVAKQNTIISLLTQLLSAPEADVPIIAATEDVVPGPSGPTILAASSRPRSAKIAKRRCKVNASQQHLKAFQARLRAEQEVFASLMDDPTDDPMAAATDDTPIHDLVLTNPSLN